MEQVCSDFGKRTEGTVQVAELGGGSVTIWGCVAARGPGQVIIVETNGRVYQGVRQDNVRVAVCKPKLGVNGGDAAEQRL